MDIYLIRHTTPKVDKGICYGATDLSVVETFPTEAQAVKSILPIYQATTLVYSSPLIRCHQLAQYIAPPQRIIVEPSFKEISFGDWEMHPWKSIDKTIMKNWFENFVNISPPNGEAFQTVFDRTIKALEIAKGKAKDQLWIVAHSGIIRAVLCHYQNIPLKDAFKSNMEYGAVYKINELTKEVHQLK